jgi:hypothetical protein
MSDDPLKEARTRAVVAPSSRFVPSSKYSPELADAIVTAVSNGQPVSVASTLAGLASGTITHWLTVARTGYWPDGSTPSPELLIAFQALSLRIQAARDAFVAKQVENIAAAGEYVGKSGIPEWRARAWLLNNHPATRKDWHEYRETKLEVSGKVNHEVRRARQAPSADVLDAADAEWREMVRPQPEPEPPPAA